MVYRRTERVEARLADNRERIMRAARQLVIEGGFRNVQVASLAMAAGLATGTVYRYFPSRADVLTELFRQASQREIDVMAEVARAPGTPRERLAAAVETFVRRAIRGRRLSWALIAEPADPALEAERLRYRIAYADVLAELISEALEQGACPPQDARVSAACVVGAMAEPLVVPLAPEDTTLEGSEGALVCAIVQIADRMVFGR